MMSEMSEANTQGGRVWCLQSICSVARLHRFVAILVFLSEVANVCYGLRKRVAWALNRAQTATNLGALSAHSPCEPDLAVAELVDAALRRTTFVL